MPTSGPGPGLLGRRRECETLNNLLAAAKAGRSQVLVLRGEPGVGKTALLDCLVEHAAGCRVRRAAGVETELELPYAGLHQLCGPYLERLDRLPEPQRDALGTAFGTRSGDPPAPLLVGLAALTLLSQLAEEQPLLCVVDDAQWLDRASVQTFAFVARRLVAQPVAMVFAACQGGAEATLTGLPDLVVTGLGAPDAAALLDTAVSGTFDARVRDRILAESGGNPLALVELPRQLSAAELAFGGAADHPTPRVHRLEQDVLRQVAPLPEPSRRLLLAAAAEPVGDISLLRRAAARLGISSDAVEAAQVAGLIEFRDRVRFRQPFARSAVYRSAAPAHRREVHEVLADVTDPHVDPDRRAWHLARAAVGPDEAVAAALERWADRALSHGGLAAAAAFLDDAAALTSDRAWWVRRFLTGAQAKVHAGAFDDARALLAAARSGPVRDVDLARIDLLRAQIYFAANRGNEASPLLQDAVRRLAQLGPRVTPDTCLDAFAAVLFAGRRSAGPGAQLMAQIVRRASPPPAPDKRDALLHGLAALITQGYAAAAPLSRDAVQSFVSDELSVDDALRFCWLAASTAVSLWDDDGWDELTRRHLQAARDVAALGALPLALTDRVLVHLFTGELAAAASLIEEARSVAAATAGVAGLATYGEACLAAVRGQEDLAGPLIQESLPDLVRQGEGIGVNVLPWARAVLCNGLGRYREALAAARQATADPLDLGAPTWALAELVEAAVHCGQAGAATAAFEQLSAMTQASGTEWALGVHASRRALLSDGGTADELYREAIERLGRTRMRVDLARVRLLYGEWLRREGRRVDARAQLRTAYESLTAMGLDAFADRARRELLATGETVRKRTVDTFGQLTAQEANIARLTREGLTNAEIGAALYISARTVEWHLRRIFAKLGVSTRRQLRLSPPDRAHPADTANGRRSADG